MRREILNDCGLNSNACFEVVSLNRGEYNKAKISFQIMFYTMEEEPSGWREDHALHRYPGHEQPTT